MKLCLIEMKLKYASYSILPKLTVCRPLLVAVAVTAARQSDANEQDLLEKTLSRINENVVFLQERLRALEEYNATLQ